MPRSRDRGPDRRARERALRAIVVTLAVALGLAAIWLIVTSNTTKRTQIGALLGFWSLLLAAYPILGTRHPRDAGTELDLRPAGRVERTEDAAERLDYERRLQLMVRHEINTALGSELASLRSEVAALRSEILEKVGGQIRLERIETTRMIGSDIEALQHEVRQLKGVGQGGGLGGGMGEFTLDTTATFVNSLDDAVARQRAAAEAEHQAQRLPSPPPAPQPLVPEPPKDTSDPFASMPRIRPFTEFDLDGAQRSAATAEPGYAGRRRRGTDAPYTPGGRHASGEAEWSTASPTGGRRRREDDDDEGILATILEREGSRG